MLAVKFVGKYLEEIVGSAFLLLMSLATLVNVIARYAFNSPISWAEEVARYAFIWMVFIGAAVCTKRSRHIAVDAVVSALPKISQPFCRLLADLATATLMVILVYYGMVLTVSATQLTSTLSIPTHFIYVVIPLSAFSIFLRAVIDLARDLRDILGALLS
jgi:TRAP-type C4-dicarboxylate transport system permease small subunit